MINNKNIFVFLLLVLFLFVTPLNCFAKKKSSKKKNIQQKVKMVETKQEWQEQAQNIPLSERKLSPYASPKTDKKTIYPLSSNFKISVYNNPPGSKEINIAEIKKTLYSYPYIVANNSFDYVAYPRYYFSPEYNQISSEFFVEKLDKTKSRKRRILDYNHNQEIRNSIIQSGMKEIYNNLFNGLTLVDWSKDSKKLLIKEKVGSTLGGIYKTYLYVHFMEDGVQPSYTLKLENLDNAIRDFYKDVENIQLVKYRYDVEPIGFSQENDDVIIVLSYVYDKNNNKIFLGTWGYNTKNNEIVLLSKINKSYPVTSNGLVLIKTLD